MIERVRPRRAKREPDQSSEQKESQQSQEALTIPESLFRV
jgi:hypothetical protein